tara:strand:- start:41 stop:553 length:513 start_codon:yes stop_codon:yes gene_type:complete
LKLFSPRSFVSFSVMSVFCFYTLFLFVRHVLADLEVYHNDPDFEAGNYGPYPVQTYNSTDIVSPHMNVLQWSSECDDGLYTFLTPRGGATHEASAMILDNNGNLVWKLEGYNQIYNLLVQEYKGEQYLTFWAGNDAVGGHGAGFYYMVSRPRCGRTSSDSCSWIPPTPKS